MRKNQRPAPGQATCNLGFQALTIALPIRTFVSFATSQVTTCSIVTLYRHSNRMSLHLMILLICTARIVIPTDTPRLIAPTPWMFFDIFHRATPPITIVHIHSPVVALRFRCCFFAFGCYFITLVIFLTILTMDIHLICYTGGAGGKNILALDLPTARYRQITVLQPPFSEQNLCLRL